MRGVRRSIARHSFASPGLSIVVHPSRVVSPRLPPFPRSHPYFVRSAAQTDRAYQAYHPRDVDRVKEPPSPRRPHSSPRIASSRASSTAERERVSDLVEFIERNDPHLVPLRQCMQHRETYRQSSRRCSQSVPLCDGALPHPTALRGRWGTSADRWASATSPAFRANEGWDSDSEMHAGKRKEGRVAGVPGARDARTGSLAADERRGAFRVRTALRRRGAKSLRAVPEGGVLAGRIEVGIAFKERVGPLREFDRPPKVRDGLALLAGEAFAASDVIEQVGVPWVARQQLASSIRRLTVIAGFVEWPHWRKQLPASRLVRLSGNTPHRDDRRVWIRSERCTFDAGRHKAERPPRARRAAHRRPRRMRARVTRDTAPRR